MESSQRPAIGALVVIAIAALLVTVMSGAPSAQRIASEFGAAGAPYATKSYCDALPELVTRFEKTILPKQAQDLATQEARLREAEAGRVEASQDFKNALRDGVIKVISDQMATTKAMAARVRGMSRSNMTELAQKDWLRKIKDIEDSGTLLQVGVSGDDALSLVKQNQDRLEAFRKFVDESGAGDMLLKGLADLVAPGVGGAVVGGIKVGIDVIYAGLKGRFTAEEAAQWRDNVDKLRNAHRDLNDRVAEYRDNLTGGLCGPKVAQQVQNSPRPIAPEAAAPPSLVTPPPSAPPPPPRSGSGMGKVIGWTAVLGGSVVGGLMMADALAQLEDLSYPSTTTTTTTTTSQPTSQPSASANYRYGNWDCGGVAQCAQVYNGNGTGSVGPLCSQDLCAEFIRVNASRNTTCTVQPLFPIRSGPAAGTACISQR